MPNGKDRSFWGLVMIALLAVVASGRVWAGQSADRAPQGTTPGVNDPWPEVNLNVAVLDKHGVPQAVDVAGFQLWEDGSRLPLHFRATADSPVSVAFLIDTSGSMDKRRALITTAVKAIVRALPGDSQIMVVPFNDASFLDLPFTPVSGADLSFLDRLQDRGGTALFDTIAASEKYFAQHAKYARRALIILSDGGDNSSHLTREEAMHRMQWPGAPAVYACDVPAPQDTFAGTRQGLRTMKALTKAGGGTVFPLDRDEKAASTADGIAAILRSQYVLRFTAANPARDGKIRKLEVRLPGKDLRILALPAYYAPGQ